MKKNDDGRRYRCGMVIFGIITLVAPDIALLILVWFFGFYAVLDASPPS
jgi:hypothetical protein